MSVASINLLKNEIEQITGYVRPTAQIKALASMNIPFRVRPNGRPEVARAAYNQALGVQASNDSSSLVTIDIDSI